jgi:phosphoribosyl 1,2-cyclic phosphodiesterase
MKLIVINSNSSGNAYALDSGQEILLLEAGMKMADVKRAIDYRLSDVVGCIVTHEHGDHCKYATEYARFGVKVFGPSAIEEKRQFPYGTFRAGRDSVTAKFGSFSVCPFNNYHDVPIFGYIIHHPAMGTLLFSTDSYKIGMTITGINHFLIEANYEDEMLKRNVRNGTISQQQADRIMLSHMSLHNCIDYLRDCSVCGCATTTRTIILCHLSERNSASDAFRSAVAGAFGIPTYIARKGLTVELNKDVL